MSNTVTVPSATISIMTVPLTARVVKQLRVLRSYDQEDLARLEYVGSISQYALGKDFDADVILVKDDGEFKLLSTKYSTYLTKLAATLPRLVLP